MKKRTALSFIIIIILILYIFLASRTIGKEYHFSPVWVRDLQKAELSAFSEKEDYIGFQLGSIFGYFSLDGDIIYLNKSLYRTALGRDIFFNYSNKPQNLVARDLEGRIQFSIDRRGYPVILRNRIFVISEEGNGISEWDREGNMLWEHWYVSLITSIDVNKENLLLGFLNGSIELIDGEGKSIYQYVPEHSRIKAVYGCALSEDSTVLALVSGIDPQRLTILENKEDTFRVIDSRITDTAFRRTMFMRFIGGYLFIEGSESINYLEVGRKDLYSVPIHGGLRAVKYDNAGKYYIFSESEGNTWLQAIESPMYQIAETKIEGAPVFIENRDSIIFLGIGYKLMRIDLLEK